MTADQRLALALEKRREEKRLREWGMTRSEAMAEVARRYNYSAAPRGQPVRRKSDMAWALWVVGILFVIVAIAARFAYVAADRPGDDFGAGAVVWLLFFLAGVLGVIWLVLAAIRWGHV